jgi:hypothetical protein
MNEEYQGFIEDLKSAVVEIESGAREYLIRGYHSIGEHIASHRYALSQVSLDSGIPLRTIQRCHQFYQKYPDLEDFLIHSPKSLSWHKITNELLPEHKEKQPQDLIQCPTCNGKGKIKNEI